jgi:hypothetical protein
MQKMAERHGIVRGTAGDWQSTKKKNSATASDEGPKEIKRMEKHGYRNLLVYNVHAKQK